MPATIPTLPSTAAPAAQIVPSGSNTAGASDNATANADIGERGSFAALFQKLTGQHIAVNTEAAEILASTEVALTTTDSLAPAEADNTLAALFPFLEAMGFTQEETAEADIAGEEIPLEAGTDAGLLAGIATAVTPPVVSTPAITAAQPASGANGQALSQSPLIDAQANPEMQPAVIAAVAAEDSQGGKGTGEFAAQFAVALEAAGDKAAATSAAANPAGATQQPAGTPAPHSSHPASPALPVEHAVGAPGWGQEVGNRIAWMANRMEHRAELILTPPQMGRVEVSLSVSGDQASASFVSANPAVREALETALPRLREVLAEAGIQLGQAQVGAENARQSAQDGKNSDNFRFDRETSLSATPLRANGNESSVSSGLKVGRGLVDVFA